MAGQLIRITRAFWPLLLLSLGNAAAQTAASDATGLEGCELSAFSTDDDPAGLNVRAGPGAGYEVIGRLPPPQPAGGDEYATEVDIVGSQDGWFRITRATANNYGDEDLLTVFEGDGWVSGRFLGRWIEGPRLYEAPSSAAPVVFDFSAQSGEEASPDYFDLERLVSCKGWWVEVEGTFHGKRLRGWTGDTCGSQVTTCP